MKNPIAVQLVTFRLPLGTTGRLDAPQQRYLIETVHQYRAVVHPSRRFRSIEQHVRDGMKILALPNGSWCILTSDSEVLESEVIHIDRETGAPVGERFRFEG